MSTTHLSLLADAARLFASRTVFKLPSVNATTTEVEWSSITYTQFFQDVENYAGYWYQVLQAKGIRQGSIVGLWLAGFSYSDVLQIYGLSRAGYIPQLFSLRLPSAEVVCELLHRAEAQALIFDPSYQHLVSVCTLPIYPALNVTDSRRSIYEAPVTLRHDPKDFVFIFHTSGSTSGSPKLVPCDYQWLESTVKKSRVMLEPTSRQRQDVIAWMGSMCHIAQTFMLIGTLQHGSCLVQPTSQAFNSGELIDMIYKCGLNRLNEFASYLGGHLRASKLDPKLLHALQSLDDVLYTGLSLGQEEEKWATQNNIKLRNLFGSTECGGVLLSYPGTPSIMRPLEGFSYSFQPLQPETTTVHQSSARLYELVIPSNSLDCPHPSLRSEDGHFHTGDLFQIVGQNRYVFRGRNDDWIKSENSLRCDTKSIEDNARFQCKNLIGECVVVGSGRPSPVMFIEPASEGAVDPDQLKREVFSKIRQFHTRRYLHEKIISADMIVVVTKNELPRTATKGNVRRQAVEQRYKDVLDQLYTRVASRR